MTDRPSRDPHHRTAKPAESRHPCSNISTSWYQPFSLSMRLMMSPQEVVNWWRATAQPGVHAYRTRSWFEFPYEKRSICQDRLGTKSQEELRAERSRCFVGEKGVDCGEFFCTLVILCTGTEMDKISFMFDVRNNSFHLSRTCRSY